MGLRIHNTISGVKEEFIPLDGNRVGMYVCGVTVYDLCHIGHARSAVVFDMIYRYLRHRGYDVTYVRNFTDIDDKIIRRAREENLSCHEVAEKYIEAFYRDMGPLRLERPTHEPRATEHIEDIIAMIARLIERGHAYRVGGDVYFSVESFKGYGRLSGRSLDELKAGARVEIDEKKNNPLDFALWKSSKPGEPSWKSPWGYGRPGWHIECSCMSQKYLGDSFDIHGGGKDLIFPHHENEIAQSEGATGKPFVKYWIHNGFVNVKQEKMSKSLGNVLNLRDLFRDYHPEVIRLFLLSFHYRSPLDFSHEALKETTASLERLYSALDKIDSMLSMARSQKNRERSRSLTSMEEEISREISLFPRRFYEAMDDDFNSARAISHLFDLTRRLNRFFDQGSRSLETFTISILEGARDAYSLCREVLGIFYEKPGDYLKEMKMKGLKRLGIEMMEIEELIQKREKARQRKDWSVADGIRRMLFDRGIVLEDGPEGTRWRIR